MNRLRDRAVLVTLVPVALAVAALGIREAARERPRAPAAVARASEFVPPPLLLLAAAGTRVDSSLHADSSQSSARVTTRRGGAAQGKQLLRPRGSLRILADDSIADLDLDLLPLAETRDSGWPRDVVMHLRAGAARCRTTAAPGVRACDLRCAVVVGGTSREALLAVTWVRLPGSAIQLHAVAVLDWAPFDLPEGWLSRMLPRDDHAVLGIDLVLRSDG